MRGEAARTPEGAEHEVERAVLLGEEKVRSALALVMSDIERSAGLAREVHVIAPTSRESAEPRAVEVNYGGHAFPLDTDMTVGEMAVLIAYFVQDDVIRDLGHGWPMSPDGRRLLLPQTGDGGAAVWFDGEVPVASVGDLPA